MPGKSSHKYLATTSPPASSFRVTAVSLVLKANDTGQSDGFCLPEREGEVEVICASTSMLQGAPDYADYILWDNNCSLILEQCGWGLVAPSTVQ